MLSNPKPLEELRLNWPAFVAELKQQLLRPRNLAIGVVLIILALLTACSPAPIVTERHVLLEPPTRFLEVTPPPDDYIGTTNEDLLLYFDEWERALNACNTDKVGILGWIEGTRQLVNDSPERHQ